MAFAHTTGTATSIANWFSTFEAWITGTVGWTVASGSGTQDLVISSTGEAGGLTKLFVNVFQNVSPSNRIRGEVRDDAAGTNKTTAGGYVEVPDVGSFTYWITADKNAIVICTKAERYNMIYLGLVEPFALSPPDETYYTIATSTNMYTIRILRGPTGSWNLSTSCADNDAIDGAGRDDHDSSVPLSRLVAGLGDGIVGLLYHVGCRFIIASVNLEDTCTSIASGGSSTWIMLGDSQDWIYPVRTGGTLPTGTGDGANFAYTTGTANSIAHFFARFNELMSQVGWGIFDNRFFSGYPGDWIYTSNGESGTENVYIRLYWSSGNGELTMVVQDGPSGSPAHSVDAEVNMQANFLPAAYHIFADRDCMCVILENPANVFRPLWGGLVIPFNPNLPSGSEYRTAIIAANVTAVNYTMLCKILRGHDGAWEQTGTEQLFRGESSQHNDDNPLDVDGTTYIIWPEAVYEFNQYGNQIQAYGRAKYLYHIDDNNIVLNDTVTVGGTPYLILYSYNFNATYDVFYGIRSDAGIFSSSSSSSFSSSSSSFSSSSFSSSSFSSSSFSSSSFSSSSSSFSSSSFSSSSFSSSSSSFSSSSSSFSSSSFSSSSSSFSSSSFSSSSSSTST